MRAHRIQNSHGVVLLEIMIAVAIFAMGMIALGQCVRQCLSAGIMIENDRRATLALENRMAQIQSGETQVGDEKTEKLKGMFEGISLKQKKVVLKEKNEKKELLNGLLEIQLTVTWIEAGEKQEKGLSFYQYAPN